MRTDEIFGWTLSIIAVVGFFTGCAIWLIHEARNAPTEVESTPLDDLLDASAGGDNLAWTDPIVLAGAESLEYAGHCCLDCGKPAEYLLAHAMSATGAPIEAAYCRKDALFAMSDEAAKTNEETES